ncbi:phage antirepressor N-terminal domain-containing protein [Serratia fonticola]|uniref:phage antirepressor N-terminal domain-containing protein n=1 Tax=Serratia fonticola TaxID=47917 RepID=UPI001AE6182E|nr:phage antirepressor N-terminal domain-containing protein [Serratia fonticola]MBP1035894.1 phage antirepressor N-terminal domain-containing protein [Serratia fonticola]
MTSIAILEAVNTTAVQFHGQPIITAMVAGVAYVAMRPIVENIGIDWAGQTVKLRKQKEKFGCCDISTPSKGGVQSMLCIPLRKLNGWLFSINPERVRADIKDKLIQYQEECFAVLHEYWTKGEVKPKSKSRHSTATQLTPLRQTAERLIATGLGRLYPDIWKLVHQRFDVEHIHQLQPEQIGEAIEYLNVLEGEFLGKQDALPAPKLELNYGMDFYDQYRWIIGSAALDSPWRYPAEMLNPNGDYPNPIGRMLIDLKNSGQQVDAAMFQLQALQHHLWVCRQKISRASLTLQ